MRRILERGLVAAVLAGTLGFGATQALAAPAPTDAERVCNPIACNRQCEAMFGPFASGFCTEGGMCACAV